MILEALAPIKEKYLCHTDSMYIPIRKDKKVIGYKCWKCDKLIPEDVFLQFVKETNKIYSNLQPYYENRTC